MLAGMSGFARVFMTTESLPRRAVRSLVTLLVQFWFMAKFKRKTTGIIHQTDWREQATKFGWQAYDLDWIASTLARDPQGIIILEVTSSAILMYSMRIAQFDGIGRDGDEISHFIAMRRTEVIHRSVDVSDAILVSSKSDEPVVDWCPAHAFQKTPGCFVCGMEPVSSLTCCDCLRKNGIKPSHRYWSAGTVIHDANCEVASLKIEDKPRIPDAIALPTPAPEQKLVFGTPLPKQKRKKTQKKTIESLSLKTR